MLIKNLSLITLLAGASVVGTIVDLGNKFGQVAKHFGTIETLEVDAAGKTIHTMTGVHFKVDTEALDFPFADYGMQNTKVEGVMTSIDKLGKLTISTHK